MVNPTECFKMVFELETDRTRLCVRSPFTSLVSKLAEMEARVLLPLGEGGLKGRMRVHFLPSPGASRHPLPEERDIPETGFQIENPMKRASVLLLERNASRNLDESAFT